MVRIDIDDLEDIKICVKCGLVYHKGYLRKKPSYTDIDTELYNWTCICGKEHKTCYDGKNEYEN